MARHRFSAFVPLAVALMLCARAGAGNGFEPEVATTEVLPEHRQQHWFWVTGMRAPNITDGRAFLFDESGRQLGRLATGFWFNSLVTADRRGELLAVETYFSRGTRGQRTDVVTRYDPRTLFARGEIEIPAKRMAAVRGSGQARLTEDGKFLLIVNYTPAQSVSVVDLDKGSLVEEVETPGCSVIYSAGNRDFHSICGNGGFLHLKLDEDGHVVARHRSQPLFDPVDDFLTISASRIGDTWYFVSRRSKVYAIRMAGEAIELVKQFPLVSDDEREDGWMISGMNHTAAHAASGRLYVVMHEGEDKTFEEPGTAVWVYDVATGRKVQEIEMEELTLSIAVSQGERPRLYTLDMHIPVFKLYALWIYLTDGQDGILKILKQRANIYDATTGAHLGATAPFPDGYLTGIQAW